MITQPSSGENQEGPPEGVFRNWPSDTEILLVASRADPMLVYPIVAGTGVDGILLAEATRCGDY